jgi:hypothetical protein
LPTGDVEFDRRRPNLFARIATCGHFRLDIPGGVAAVRTVAPGFKPGVTKDARFQSALKRAKERGALVLASR